MSTTFKPLFGTSNQAITITLASLLNNGQRSSLAIDNSTLAYGDAEVVVKVTIPSGGLATGTVNVYAYSTADGGATYGGGETGMGTDAGVTLTSPPNIRLIGFMYCPAAGTYVSDILSPAKAAGLGDHWGIVVENKTGVTLTSGSAWYQGLQVQGV